MVSSFTSPFRFPNLHHVIEQNEREREMRKVNKKKNISVRWKKNSLDRWTEKERKRKKS